MVNLVFVPQRVTNREPLALDYRLMIIDISWWCTLLCRLMYLVFLGLGTATMSAMLTPNIQHNLQSAFKGNLQKFSFWPTVMTKIFWKSCCPHYLKTSIKSYTVAKWIIVFKKQCTNSDNFLKLYYKLYYFIFRQKENVMFSDTKTFSIM
jgi:hypothetical protein